MRHTTLTRSAATLLVGCGALLLAGCTPSAEPDDDRAAEASESATPSATPLPSSDPSVPPGTTEGTPVGVGCLDLVSLETMYEFDPNFALVDGYSPEALSRGATALAENGVACRWQQLTSGETIDITAARPSPDSINRLKTEAGAADGRETFAATGAVGTVQVFGSGFWITAESSYFTSAADARLLVDSAVAAVD